MFHQDNALGYELLPHSLYSPGLAPSDLFLFADLNKILAGKKFNTNEEVIAESVSFFEAIMSQSYYKNGIKIFFDRYNRCIALDMNYID
jgi:hypothetical protein